MKKMKWILVKQVIEERRCPAVLPPIKGTLCALRGRPSLGLATQRVRILVDGTEVFRAEAITCGDNWIQLRAPIDLSKSGVEIQGDRPDVTFTVFLDMILLTEVHPERNSDDEQDPYDG